MIKDIKIPKDTKKSSFQKSYQELQKLVEWFDREDIDLEEGMAKLVQGAALVKELKTYLATAENKVKELKKSLA